MVHLTKRGHNPSCKEVLQVARFRVQRDRLSELAARQAKAPLFEGGGVAAKALLLEGGRVATKVAPVEGGDAQNQVPNEIIELHFKAWLQSALTLL